MPLAPLTGLVAPPSDAVLWRYMPLPAFLRLLQTSQLHFTRADQFNDKWEGIEPEENLKQFIGFVSAKDPDFLKRALESRHLFRKLIFLNCWHEAAFESAAMWSLYAGHTCGVTIRSSVKRLADSFRGTPASDIRYARVRYDHSTHVITENNYYHRFFVKRESFNHEREVRLLFDGPVPDQPAGLDHIPLDLLEAHNRSGLDVRVDLTSLIEEVLISPTTADWEASVVEYVLKTLGFTALPIRRSKINDLPF